MRSFMRSRRTKQRSGAVLLCVLVCLGISLSLVMLSIRSSLSQRRQMTREIQLEQTRWLLDAGLRRGLALVRSDDDYAGETWDVTDALEEPATASIEVRVVRSDDSPVQLSVTAVVQQPDENSSPTRRSQTWLINTDSEPTQSPDQ